LNPKEMKGRLAVPQEKTTKRKINQAVGNFNRKDAGLHARFLFGGLRVEPPEPVLFILN
jgi:hypothetical protein